ncbi:aa3-type cytochrome c oxidase subunit IV [Rhizobium mayense]|uniref:Aa3-type cytochrome c oxidase subunit IV n=1 Tax=Rhizobium mayense TaxID=1312184 RepID=A0ABT7JSL1_9HYPH|nr:aa3-type cytochrome c oxidase subunit IV [Rhizobium mayense]MDL2399331.1 aa3-type cytochrome c oxidase subunit IV [Rhizobium mayense]
MAEHHTGPVEMGAPMDYKEHEKTYNLFLRAAKLGTTIVAALLIGMAAGFFGHAGFLGGFLIFIILAVVGSYLTL